MFTIMHYGYNINDRVAIKKVDFEIFITKRVQQKSSKKNFKKD